MRRKLRQAFLLIFSKSARYTLPLVVALAMPSIGASANDSNSPTETGVDRVIWNHVPIDVVLKVGETNERRIYFPEPVKIWRPSKLKGVLGVQSVDNVVYWTAFDEFQSTRITVQELATNDTYLINLSASKSEGDTRPIQIVRSRMKNPSQAQFDEEKSSHSSELDEITLVRYAIQQAYAPKRVLSDINQRIPGVLPVQVPAGIEYKMYIGGSVKTRPLQGWRSESLYVTTIIVKNDTDKHITLEAMNLRGELVSAVFQHMRIAPKGDPRDTTALYVVTSRPFAESMRYVQKVAPPKPVKKDKETLASWEEEY